MLPSFAINLMQLININNPKTNERAFNCKVYRVKYNKVGPRFIFLVKCKESYSSSEGHLVSIKFLNYDSTKKRQKYYPLNSDVKLRCSCPAWLYWGSAYNSTQEKYNYRMVEKRPPDIRDPFRINKVCKHVAKVRFDLRNKTFTMLKKRHNKSLLPRTSSRMDLQNVYIDIEDIPEVSIKECSSAILKYLDLTKKDINKLAFIQSLNEDNFEEKLLEIEAIV